MSRSFNSLKKGTRGGILVFALAALAITGIVIASFLTQSEKSLSRAKSKSEGLMATQRAHANYERAMNYILKAYTWALAVRAGEGSLPVVNELTEAYGGSLDSLRTAIANCSSSCFPDPDFLSKIYPASRAAEEGWRYKVTALSNPTFDTTTTSFPKRFALTIYQSDKNSEIRVSGQFILSPTSLAAFGALAWGIPADQPIALGEGKHGNIGLFFTEIDKNGVPLVPDPNDCIDAGEYVAGRAPNLQGGSIYLLPPQGTSLEMGILASNRGLDNLCHGLNRASQYAYWWSNETNVGDVKMDGLMTIPNVGEHVEATFRRRFSDVHAAILANNPFVPPGGSASLASVSPKTYSELDSFSGSTEVFPSISGTSYYEALAAAGEIDTTTKETLKTEYAQQTSYYSGAAETGTSSYYQSLYDSGKIDEATYQKYSSKYSGIAADTREAPSGADEDLAGSGTDGGEMVGGDGKDGKDGKDATSGTSGTSGTTGATGSDEAPSVTSCPYDWAIQQAELSLGACSDGAASCTITFTETYTSACRAQSVVHTVYNGSSASLPSSYQRSLATLAPEVIIKKASSVSGNSAFIGLPNLTILAQGPARLLHSIEKDPDLDAARGGDPENQGLFSYVNVGAGHGAVIHPDFTTRQGVRLGDIYSGTATEPSASTLTAEFNVGFFALGSPADNQVRSLVVHPDLLVVREGTNRRLGKLVQNGPTWGPLLPSLRISNTDYSAILTGFQVIETSYPDAWTKSVATEVESAEYLSYHEISRSLESRGSFEAALEDAQAAVGGQ